MKDFDQIRGFLSGELGNEKSRPMPPRRRWRWSSTPPFQRVIESK
ncbi:hypothetical protein CGRA01v4_09105 [Colletotrichum graminicola]|nr:hypothetical protein CGRA01v4_09105 [Colletotrichum graminicola]